MTFSEGGLPSSKNSGNFIQGRDGPQGVACRDIWGDMSTAENSHLLDIPHPITRFSTTRVPGALTREDII